jgi:hypothetical protein
MIPAFKHLGAIALPLLALMLGSAGSSLGQDELLFPADTTFNRRPAPETVRPPERDGTTLFNDITSETASAPAQDSLRLLDPRSSLPDSLRDDDQSFILFLDKIEVEGKLEKPQAIFIIPGSDPEIDDIQIQRSFFEEIFRQVEPAGRIGLKQKPSSTSKRKDVFPW